jgi:hypothetical protein
MVLALLFLLRFNTAVFFTATLRWDLLVTLAFGLLTGFLLFLALLRLDMVISFFWMFLPPPDQ